MNKFFKSTDFSPQVLSGELGTGKKKTAQSAKTAGAHGAAPIATAAKSSTAASSSSAPIATIGNKKSDEFIAELCTLSAKELAARTNEDSFTKTPEGKEHLKLYVKVETVQSLWQFRSSAHRPPVRSSFR